MIAAALVSLFGALRFSGEDLTGLTAGSTDPLTGRAALHAIQADLDGDGAMDLMLPAEVWLQRAGTYPRTHRVALPRAGECPNYDTQPEGIMARLPGSLEAYALEGGAWRNVLAQPIEWPDAAERAAAAEPGHAPSIERFLHDIDSDSIPEILVPGPGGVYLYRKNGGLYALDSVLRVYPAAQTLPVTLGVLWPPGARRPGFPVRQMNCRILVEGGQLTVLQRQEIPADQILYTITRHNLAAVLPGEQPGILDQFTTGPMPEFVAPVRLNEDGSVDFAGGDWNYSDATPLPTPIFRTVASTNRGESMQSIRTQSFRPRCSFFDVNGDGRVDAIAEHMKLFDGGVREAVNRFATQRTIDHEIRVHYQDEAGIFSRMPSIRHLVRIDLGRPAIRGGSQFEQYRSGGMIDVSGDFDGGGLADLLVQDRSDRLTVFLNRGGAFSGEPGAEIPLPPGARHTVADVNGDGYSDIVIAWKSEVPESEESTRVYFARGGR